MGCVALIVVAACGDDTSVSTDESTSTGEDPHPWTSGGGVTPGTSFDSGVDPDDGGSVGVEAFCGDAIVTLGEQCDGDNLGGKTCADFGWPDGPNGLRCNDDCELDLSSCVLCGNGVVDQDTEECDGDDTVDADCADIPGLLGGEVGCREDCRLDYSECESSCGNGVIDPGEDCEVEGFFLCDEVFGAGWSGQFICRGCKYFVFDCSECGDGILDEGELCDGLELDGATCEDQGFVGGTLGCLGDCTYDISNCGTCGDGIAVASEACDGDDLAGWTCVDAFPGAQGGTLTCGGSCEFDPSQCLFIGEADVVISEILYAAEEDPDIPTGQWIELHNPHPTQAWNLGGCELDSNLPFETFTLGPLVIEPGAYATLGTGDVGDLFFVPDAFLGPSYSLANTGDVVRLRCGATLVDEVTYGNMAPWPAVQPGSAIATATLNAVGNDDGDNWCAATIVLAGLTYGTPGMANDCS